MRRLLSSLLALILTAACCTTSERAPTPRKAGWGVDHRWIGPVEGHPHPGPLGELRT